MPLPQLFDVYSQQSIDAHNKHSNILKRTGATQAGKARLKMTSTIKHMNPTGAERTLGYVLFCRDKISVLGWGGGRLRVVWRECGRYDQYIQLARDMGCGALIHISVVDLGDAYLTTITVGFIELVQALVQPQVCQGKEVPGSSISRVESLPSTPDEIPSVYTGPIRHIL
jgi:hypothetical protein